MTDPTREYLLSQAQLLGPPGAWSEWIAHREPRRGDFLLAEREIKDYSVGNRKRLAEAALHVVRAYIPRYTDLHPDLSYVERWVYDQRDDDPRESSDMHTQSHSLAMEAAGSLVESELNHWAAHRMEAAAYILLAVSNLCHSEAHITLRPAQAVGLCIKAAEQAHPDGRRAGLEHAQRETYEIVAERLAK